MEVGESAVAWTLGITGPADAVDDETIGVVDATGLAALAGIRSFLLWLQSFVISRTLPWLGLQGRVATWKINIFGQVHLRLPQQILKSNKTIKRITAHYFRFFYK